MSPAKKSLNRIKNNVPIGTIYSILDKEVTKYKVPIVDLIQVQTKDPYKVLVATILSARTGDKTTADAARRLFTVAPTMQSLSSLTPEVIEKLIYPVGFYKNKTAFLKKLPKTLNEKFGGVIPDTVDELITLDGVGRKTANLVVAVGFDKPAICVDVHVNRIMNRLGYIKTKTPYESEMMLRKKLPKKYWKEINRLLVAFGQNICRPQSPKCSICPISKYCLQVGVEKAR